MAGQATYCAAKAGMDQMLSRAIALDQAELANGARIVALAPGVIDTDMQVQLRGADGAGFPDQGNFIRLKESGQLTSSHDAAARVIAYLQRKDFGTSPVADVREDPEPGAAAACIGSLSPFRVVVTLASAVLGSACAPLSPAPAGASGSSAAAANADVVAPNPNLVVQGIPPIPSKRGRHRRAIQRLSADRHC